MSVTAHELLDRARRHVPEVSVEEVKERLDRGEDLVLIDVREREEVQNGYIAGARHITRGMLEFKVHDQVPDLEAPVVVYCAAGLRSLFAARVLQEMGYRDVSSMAGGFSGWKERGYPFVQDRVFTPEQMTRYSRHFLLDEIGERGQAQLLDARVLMVGTGGLGSPAAIYLAAAGVGTLGLVDNDLVDPSNLQRQILHTTERVGTPKTDSAEIAIKAINPDVHVVKHNVRLTAENAREIIAAYDLVVDGCDNFPTRYLVNDACVILGKPDVSGSIHRFEGQVTVFHTAAGGPCYRCLFPEPPPPGLVPS